MRFLQSLLEATRSWAGTRSALLVPIQEQNYTRTLSLRFTLLYLFYVDNVFFTASVKVSSPWDFCNYNRGLLLFSFWTRAESDCLHTRLKGEWIVDIRCMNRRTMDIVNLICRQSLSALFQKLNNDKPLLTSNMTIHAI